MDGFFAWRVANILAAGGNNIDPGGVVPVEGDRFLGNSCKRVRLTEKTPQHLAFRSMPIPGRLLEDPGGRERPDIGRNVVRRLSGPLGRGDRLDRTGIG